MKNLELKIYKHEFGSNLVMSLLRLGKEGYDNIVWDGIGSETEDEWTLLSKGEVELNDDDISEVLKGINRNGETWEVELSNGNIAVIEGPNEEIIFDGEEK